MKAEETFAVVRAFMKAFACVIAQIEDMPPSAKTTTFAIQLLEELGVYGTRPLHGRTSGTIRFDVGNAERRCRGSRRESGDSEESPMTQTMTAQSGPVSGALARRIPSATAMMLAAAASSRA